MSSDRPVPKITKSGYRYPKSTRFSNFGTGTGNDLLIPSSNHPEIIIFTQISSKTKTNKISRVSKKNKKITNH
ncbi:hypothetical protein Hanom_Chr04g00358331 [Helianthus anomalus]